MATGLRRERVARRDPNWNARAVEPTHPDSVPPLFGEDHVCTDCDMDYAATTVDDVRAIAAAVPGQARELVDATSDEDWRRADEGWCAAEYLCHVRDVFGTFTIRLFR